jgi:predicted aspartyl protease
MVVGGTVVDGTVVDGTVAGTVVGTVVDVGTSGATTNPEKANRLGLPTPMLNNAPLVAFATRRCSTCC